ncbi:MAG: NitT/TauT family transport system substrate-binding protein [Myxococcota bacterium]
MVWWILACSGTQSDETLTPQSGTPALTPVRLALNWYPEPEFGGFYEGVLGGHYEAAGFDVTIIPGGPGAPSLELLASGQVEAAISAADDLLIKRSKGIEAVGVFPSLQINPQGVMVHSSSGLTQLSDLTDGRLAIEIGSPFQSFLWQKVGLEGKVEPIPYGGSVGPFLVDETFRQQAFITSEPCLAEGQGATISFLKAADVGWNPYAALLTVADPPPPWAAKFVTATRAAWQAYLDDPTRANAELARLNDQLKPELLACITDAQRPFVVGEDGLGAMTEARWEATRSALVELGLLETGVSADGAWKVF